MSDQTFSLERVDTPTGAMLIITDDEQRLHHAIVDLEESRVQAAMIGFFIAAFPGVNRRRSEIPLVHFSGAPAGVVRVHVDEHVVEAARRDLVDKPPHELSRRVEHVGAP